MAADFDAVIVGAGPAGSAAAIILARAGWSVALVEKQPFPRRKVCGECIAASNLPLLEELGIASALEASAGPELRRVALMQGERETEAALPAAAHARHRYGRALGRETLDTLLLDQARDAGAQVFQPYAVQSMEGGAGCWKFDARANGPGSILQLRSRVAIDAHGSWEALPSGQVRHRMPRRPTDLFAFKANFHGTSLRPGLLPVLCLDGGYGGMVVADGGVTTLACCIRSDRLDALRRAAPGSRAGDVVESWLRRECRGVRIALQEATRNGPWLAAGPISPGIRLRADGGPLRIGNAAGEAHPILGEGMSMALQSAGLLCARLLRAQHGGSMSVVTRQREVERAYSRDWRRHFAPRLRLAASFAHLAMRPAAGGLLVSLARTFPQFLTEGARLGGKVRCAADLQAFTVSIPGPGVSASPPTASCFATRPAGTPREEMT